jgi:hypothetical protein
MMTDGYSLRTRIWLEPEHELPKEERLTNALHWTPALLRFLLNPKGHVLAVASERGRYAAQGRAPGKRGSGP